MFCSARIYMVPARPAWCSRYTIVEFFSTAVLLGPLFVWTLEIGTLGAVGRMWLARAAVAGGAAQLLTQVLKFLWLSRSETFELRASALLLSGRLQNAFLIRLGILIAAGIVLPLTAHTPWADRGHPGAGVSRRMAGTLAVLRVAWCRRTSPPHLRHPGEAA